MQASIRLRRTILILVGAAACLYFSNGFLLNRSFSYAVHMSASLRHKRFCDMRYIIAILSHYDFSYSDLSGSDLEMVSFRYSKFVGSDLSGDDLSNCDFTNADLTDSTLTKASFDHTTFRKSNLQSCNLKGASFEGAEIYESDLRGANLSGASLTNCLYDKQTVWPTGYDPAKHGAKLTVTPPDLDRFERIRIDGPGIR